VEGEQLDLLKEYMKLKEQINDSLSNRTSNNNPIVSANQNMNLSGFMDNK